MNYCGDCGNKLEKNDKFCGNCGIKLSIDSESQLIKTSKESAFKVEKESFKEKPISNSEKSDEIWNDDKYLIFVKRIKNYIIGAYVLGLVWAIGNNGLKPTISDLIVQPLVIALFLLLVSIVFYFIALSSSKKEENAFKVFKIIYNTLFTIIILVVVFSITGKAYVDN